jgi:pimeloyl-ACP methyl ester carboxylesterase
MQRLHRDGVALAYEEAGNGDPPILLVHGWCCDHTYFLPQFEYFCPNHRVVAVDLRGHGQSDKPHQNYTMAAFADDLAWFCGQTNVKKPVVIGHSMGGLIATQLAAQSPDLPSAIIAIDTPLLPSQEQLNRWKSVVESLRGPTNRDIARQFVEAMFLPTDDQRRKAQIVGSMTGVPHHVMASAFQQVTSWGGAAVLSACKVPTLLISAGRYVVNVDRLRELCPQLVFGQTVGSGHFNQLEVPDQVNGMIERFIAISLPTGKGE